MYGMSMSDGWVLDTGRSLIGLFETQWEAEDYANREFAQPENLTAIRLVDRGSLCEKSERHKVSPARSRTD